MLWNIVKNNFQMADKFTNLRDKGLIFGSFSIDKKARFLRPEADLTYRKHNEIKKINLRTDIQIVI